MSRYWLKPFARAKQRPREATKRSFRPQVEALESRLVLSQFFEAEGTAILGGIGPYFDGGGIHDYPRPEDVTISGQTNYDGPGYVNLAYSDDSTITWNNVTEDQAGDYTVAFRYSMNTYYTSLWVPARPMGLMVNGNVITRALEFVATGNSDDGVDPWSIWKDLPITVQLNAGANTIELFATDLAATGANPHLDSMTITPVPDGVAPAAPANLSASAGVGDVDLSWKPSPIATSYNIYRSTDPGNETLIASGVTSTYFFDTGLASDGTSYFYLVSAVNSAGESATTNETSATPSAPDGLLFSDDFSNGPSAAWSFTPDDGYWLPQVGQLTDAGGDTVANVPQTATVVLPPGAVSWQADLLSKVGYGAGVDQQGNPGITGISVQSADGLNAVFFSKFNNLQLNVGKTVNGVFLGWTPIGTEPRINHPSGPELLVHTYQIQLDAGGTFSVLFDGTVLTSSISAGPPSAWDAGIGSGSLFTLSSLNDRHLSAYFDNVRALGAAPPTPSMLAALYGDAPVNLIWNATAGATSYPIPNVSATPGGGQVSLSGTPSAGPDNHSIDQSIGSGVSDTAFTDSNASDGTTYLYEVGAFNKAGENGLFNLKMGLIPRRSR
jgi:hypothetical protein